MKSGTATKIIRHLITLSLLSGLMIFSSAVFAQSPADKGERGQQLHTFSLSQNYPNPFNPTTRIDFNLPKAAQVKITIYNILGEKMAVLLNEPRDAGSYTVTFTADHFPSGIYFYEMTAGEFKAVKRMILLK